MFQRTLSRGAFAATVVIGLAGCANAKDADPETKTFEFKGEKLDVRAHGIPTDLVPSDRKDVQVTRWFDVKAGAEEHSSWTLKKNVLDLKAECENFANCDVRYRVDVPKSVKVLRDGRGTDLKGTDAAGPAPRTDSRKDGA